MRKRHRELPQIVVLSGAGLSAESGISTFRDVNGLWNNYRIEEVASYEAFCHKPELVWEFYKMRFLQLKDVIPNPAHYAIARLEKSFSDNLTIITQNVDGLLSIAGCQRVLEMHGSLLRSYCNKCHTRIPTSELDLSLPVPRCTKCGGHMRPDIVWFGEVPHYMEEIQQALHNVDIFMVIGTSGVVYPAAAFLSLAKNRNAKTLGVNLRKPQNLVYIDEFHQGKAGEILPSLVEKLLKEYL